MRTSWISFVSALVVLTMPLPPLHAQHKGYDGLEFTSLEQGLPSALESTEKIRLRPESHLELGLEASLGLEVEVTTIEGASFIQVISLAQDGGPTILKVVPDFENKTYSAEFQVADPETLKAYGFPALLTDEKAPQNEIFGSATCRRATVLARVHSGSASVIRSSTETSVQWRFDDSHGSQCISLLNHSRTCTPAFGMSNIGCNGSASDDGTSTASVDSGGSYSGTPPGSQRLSVVDSTVISINRTSVSIVTAAAVLPTEVPAALFQVVSTPFFNCPFGPSQRARRSKDPVS